MLPGMIDPHSSADGMAGIVGMLQQELMTLTGVTANSVEMLRAVTEIGRELQAYGSEIAPIAQQATPDDPGASSVAWLSSVHAQVGSQAAVHHAVQRPAAASVAGYWPGEPDRRIDSQARWSPASPMSQAIGTTARAPTLSMIAPVALPAAAISKSVLDASDMPSSLAELSEVIAFQAYPVSPVAQPAQTTEQSDGRSSNREAFPPSAPGSTGVDVARSIASASPMVLTQTTEPADGRAISEPSTATANTHPNDLSEVSGPAFAKRGARQNSTPGSAAPVQGTIYVDGSELGRWAVDYLSRRAARPVIGTTGIDPRATPTFPGAPNGT